MKIIIPKILLSSALITGVILTTLVFDAHAQQSQRITATVNDELISAFDLESRISLMISFLRIENNQQTRSQLRRQALNDLINAKLKLQEAKAFNITTNDLEIDRAIRNLEKQNNMQKDGMGQLMDSLNIPRSALRDRFEADISWAKFLNRRFRGNIQISEKELDNSIKEIEDNKGEPEVLVSEIFLAVKGDKKQMAVQDLADELYQELKKGANFGQVAKSYSESPTAAVGGDLGWSRADRLSPNLQKIIASLNQGDISKPILTRGGYYIVELRNKRIALGLGTSEAKPALVELFQIILPLPENPSEEAISDKLRQGQQITDNAKECNNMESYAAQLGSDLSGNLGLLKTTSLSPQLKSLVKDLAVNQPSQPVVLGGNVVVIMVCSKKVEKVVELSDTEKREIQRRALINQRMDLAARQHLLSLRRAAFIDVRQ